MFTIKNVQVTMKFAKTLQVNEVLNVTNPINFEKYPPMEEQICNCSYLHTFFMYTVTNDFCIEVKHSLITRLGIQHHTLHAGTVCT